MNTKAAALLMVGLLGAPVVFHLTQPDWEILQQGNGYRFMFNRRTGEFFVPGVTGVHSPGEKLVPIASKKKSTEQRFNEYMQRTGFGRTTEGPSPPDKKKKSFEQQIMEYHREFGDPELTEATEGPSQAAHSDLNTITNADEKTAALAFKKAGANVFLNAGTVTDIGFMQGGCDDALAASLSNTPNVERLTLFGCSKVTDKSVAAISGLKKLKMAMLSGTGITAAGAKKILAAVGSGGMVMHPATQGSMMKARGGGAGGAKKIQKASKKKSTEQRFNEYMQRSGLRQHFDEIYGPSSATEAPSPSPTEPTKQSLGDRLIDTSISTVMLCVFLGLIGGVTWLLRSGFNRVFQVEITCKKCGHVSKDESLECVRCGTKLA